MKPETLEDAIAVFSSEMLAKFHLRDERQGERSVTRVGNSLLLERGVHTNLWGHLYDEIREMNEAISTPEEAKEAIDVANMAFLLWWRAKAERERNGP